MKLTIGALVLLNLQPVTSFVPVNNRALHSIHHGALPAVDPRRQTDSVSVSTRS
jgi:hypothetical protein